MALLDKEGEADDEGDRCDDGVGRLLLDAEGHPEVLLLPLALPSAVAVAFTVLPGRSETPEDAVAVAQRDAAIEGRAERERVALLLPEEESEEDRDSGAEALEERDILGLELALGDVAAERLGLGERVADAEALALLRVLLDTLPAPGEPLGDLEGVGVGTADTVAPGVNVLVPERVPEGDAELKPVSVTVTVALALVAADLDLNAEPEADEQADSVTNSPVAEAETVVHADADAD